MKNQPTNYGKLLAEIQFFASQDNDYMVDKLSKLLEAAKKKDKEIAELEAQKIKKELQ